MVAEFATSTASARAGGDLATADRPELEGERLSPGADADANADPALQAYIRRLEELFVALRGRGLVWTRDDVECATAWWRAGVALTTARRVVEGRVRAQIAVGGALAAAITLRSHDAALRKTLGLGVPAPDAARGSAATTSARSTDWAIDPALDEAALRAAEARSLAAVTADPALSGAIASAGKTMARRLAEPDADGASVFAAGHLALRRRLLLGIGATARAGLEIDVNDLVALGLTRAGAYEVALSALCAAPWPDLEGWRPRPAPPAWRPRAAGAKQPPGPPASRPTSGGVSTAPSKARRA